MTAKLLFSASLLWAATLPAVAHPGSGIVVDSQGIVYFVDTGHGVWKLEAEGKLTLVHRSGYHWMALDEKGHFAKAGVLGDFDGGSFERVTPAGSIPAVILSSDYPIAAASDGFLYYVPYKPRGPRELVRRTSTGQRSVAARLPSAAGASPMQWVNGIGTGPNGALYTADNDSVKKIDRDGTVSTFRDAVQAPHCIDPLPDTPGLPYLRDLAVARDGTVYAAASGCRAVISIPAAGPIRTLLQSERPWAPTGIALSGEHIYVLEYLHTPGDNRSEWIPRVRRIGPDGKTVTLVTVER